MTIPPPPPQQSGQPGPSGPFGVPPGRFTPSTTSQHVPRSRDLGVDPALEQEKKRPWLPWLIGGLGGVAVIVVVAIIIVSSFRAPNPLETDPEVGTVAEPPETANPTSSYEPAEPVEPPAGSTIPITTDVAFPGGMTFVMPNPGDWTTRDVERQPDAIVMEDPQTGAYLQFLQTAQPSGTYRDEDVTTASLNTAYLGYTGSPHNAGAPSSVMVTGGGGYQLELLAQRVEWDMSSNVALTIERLMPQTGVAIHIFVIATESDISNTDSRLWQKLNQLTFTVP
ncbi:MAG: hypothetical protein ACTH31_02785 [Pseudoclavibacter sp.]